MFIRLFTKSGESIQICEDKKSLEKRMGSNIFYPWYGMTDREMEVKVENGRIVSAEFTSINPRKFKIDSWKFEYGTDEELEVFKTFLRKAG